MNKAGWKIFCIFFSLVIVLGGWHLTSIILNTPALPSPIDAIYITFTNFSTLAGDAWISLYRMLISLALGTIIGYPIGVLLGTSQKLNDLLSPAFYMLYPLPKIVFLPLLLILLGLGDVPKVALVTITVVFQVIVVMRDACLKIDKSHKLALQAIGASKFQMFKYVVLPATLPGLFSSLRISSAIGIAVLFISESVAGSTGLGYFIMNSWALVDYSRMFAGVFVLAIIGIVLFEIFDILEKRLSNW
ncbi:MAG: ABC transporter permease [Coriobacteriales bacterium]|nr:ABC transporter permease [Coriobacteriales bacterium]